MRIFVDYHLLTIIEHKHGVVTGVLSKVRFFTVLQEIIAVAGICPRIKDKFILKMYTGHDIL